MKPLISVDFETGGEGASGGLEMYRQTSFVKSCAFAWRNSDGEILTRFVQDPVQIKADLDHIVAQEIPILVFNMGFEGVVFQSKYGIKPIIEADVMRLVQMYDNTDAVKSFGLKDATRRLVPQNDGYDYPIYRWLALNLPEHREKVIKKAKQYVKKSVGQEQAIRDYVKRNKKQLGQHLSQAPASVLAQYNNADAVNTLLIYEIITKYFAEIGFDWRFDQKLYQSSAWEIVASKIKGLLISHKRLKVCIEETKREIDGIEARFKTRFASEIGQLQIKGEFNINSLKHLEALFCGVLKIKPVHFSKSGKAPSFSDEHLYQFGEGGEMLMGKKSHELIYNQARNLMGLSEYDGRFHCDLKLTGTITGRYSGGKV